MANRSAASGVAKAEEIRSRAPRAKIPTFLVETADDDEYDEQADPDFEQDDSEIQSADESDLELVSASSISDDEELGKSSSYSRLSVLVSSPFNRSTADLLLGAHKRFGKFVHKHEVPRKVFHVSIGFITLYLYTQGIQIQRLVVPLFAGFFGVSALDLIRFRSKRFNDLYCAAVGFLMREKEVNSYNGVIWYLLGLALVFVSQKKDVAVMSVLLLSWSDTAASTFGRAFGHLTPKVVGNKSLAGSTAAAITGVLASYLFYGYFIPHYPQVNVNVDLGYVPAKNLLNIHVFSLLAGLIAAVSESIDLFGWDDNFTIPVLSGGFFWVVLKLTGA
ncbi:unnamed protein product [Kuraishia capsulata CBS 1993]|uniref:Uncharacterized protein n=1 Tax=Kuraishia capsulata CBS 1993 TaxID=1382522 RepID=W6MW98_9ASCO|nr:uncharacterized protein KUCA_T00003047001 [Kuraishia capsulata CBS 1993]CDK27070.1 unnamed protein product [Kuraishia capsulata CBS 1993]